MSETPERRSRTMRAVRSHDTGPELAVRRMVREMGYGYRLHQKDLPGKPDLVFRGRRKAVFVHGCFWHGHGCPRGARRPKRNREYWTAKISRNRERDERNIQELVSVRWDVLVLWECQLRDSDRLRGLIKAFLDLDSTGRRVSDQSTAKATIDEATNAQDVALAEEVLERIRIGDEELIDAQEMWGRTR
ncbi:very short patch repair endonuclease [Candidatus Palauibacter sp.]|uniref:very short patch repair endonuclease n=1 Tax=Candidatus Palauibacter sp. TaxID=3101350 RepID=UPI003B0257BF